MGNLHQPRPQAEWPEYNTQGQFRFDGELVTVEGAEQLAEFLADSGRLESCWAQQYFRYTMGRLETASDLFTIESLADRLRSGEPLSEVFKGIALYRGIQIDFQTTTGAIIGGGTMKQRISRRMFLRGGR